MSSASDKARFYLEQYVPELQEYERKEIFTRDQISAIAAKRSDFEHVLNARGSQPADYARYATYEMNLDTLRKKRCQRLKIKGTNFSGQRTVFFILERATKKFPGDIGLWMQYIRFCQQEEATKKLAKAFTGVLRLKPREWGLWVLAAKHYAENRGDMTTARSYMQRGLRFCKDRKELYLEYAKLEMVYLAKLAARRKILGLDEERKEKEQDKDEDENMIVLPEISAEDLDPEANKGVEEVDRKMLERLATVPAYTGAIPMAIFDAAMRQFDARLDVTEDFFDLFSTFNQVPSSTAILQYIIDYLQATAPDSSEAIICEARLSLRGTDTTSAEFPTALGVSLSKVKKGLGGVQEEQRSALAGKAVLMLLPLLEAQEGLDEDVGMVVVASLNRYLRLVSTTTRTKSIRSGVTVVDALAWKVQEEGTLAGPQMLEVTGGKQEAAVVIAR